MFSKRSLSAFLLTFSIGTAAVITAFAPESALAGGPCDKYKKAEVKKVCTDSGKTDPKDIQKAIRKAMKGWQKTAEKKDDRFKKCSACHTEQKGDWPLNKEAEKLWGDFMKVAK